MCKIVECCVYDIAVKSWNKGDHLHDLRMVFSIMQAHRLNMNNSVLKGSKQHIIWIHCHS